VSSNLYVVQNLLKERWQSVITSTVERQLTLDTLTSLNQVCNYAHP